MTPRISTASLLTTTQAAKYLNIHVNTIRRWSDKGAIKAYRFGTRGDRRYKRDDINLFLQESIDIGNSI